MENNNAFDRLPDSMKRILKSTSEQWHKTGYYEALAHCVNSLIEKGYQIEDIKIMLNLSEQHVLDLQSNFQIPKG